MSRQPSSIEGQIAVVGEREVVLGYRLLGVEDTFVVGKEEAQRTLLELLESGKYGLIIVSENLRRGLTTSTKEKLDSSIVPLVIFLPSPYSVESEESLSALAKRVLGVDIKVSGGAAAGGGSGSSGKSGG